MAFVYEYGQRWNAKTPRYVLGRIVDRLHVSKSDVEITAIIEDRLKTAGEEFTPGIRRECVRYAIERHKRNRAGYSYVMGVRK